MKSEKLWFVAAAGLSLMAVGLMCALSVELIGINYSSYNPLNNEYLFNIS